MKHRRSVLVLTTVLGLLLPVCHAQENETPLGDIARALRKSKQKAAERTVIDNDNFSQVMEEAESQRAKGFVKFSFDGSGRDIQVSSPDVTCSLAFSAEAAQASQPSGQQDLPTSELAKLDGPASISGDTLQVSVYNGTEWKVNEITVGLTILRPSDTNAAYFGSAKLVPAAAGHDATAQKRSDMTVLYHLKGAAAPSSTAVFRQTLGVLLSPDQEWHWAIVQARGIPPR
jgi:hypothetical protein